MLLLGVADCCRLIHRFAFTVSAMLPNRVRLCFGLRVVASSKRQTNGNFLVADEWQATAIGDNDPSMSTSNIEVDEELIGILRELEQPVDKAATELIVLELGKVSSGRSASILHVPQGFYSARF